MAGNASRDIVLKSIPNRNMLTMGKSPAVNFAFPIQMYSIQMYLAPRVAIVMAKERVLGWEKGSAWTWQGGWHDRTGPRQPYRRCRAHQAGWYKSPIRPYCRCERPLAGGLMAILPRTSRV